jgi:DNA-binding GntR family transcriptional regulator
LGRQGRSDTIYRAVAHRDKEYPLNQDANLRYRTKAELIYEHLRSEILAGRPAPGSRLVVDQIAEHLGVSKVPVREAITRLTGEGWLEVRPHAGPVLPVITPAEIRETALIRGALESTAIRAAAEHHDASTHAALVGLIDRMDRAVEEFPRLNLELHSAVIAPAPYPRMKSMAVSLMERALRYQIVHRVPGYLDQAQIEHRQIVEALTAGDTERAGELTKQHILTAAERLAASI